MTAPREATATVSASTWSLDWRHRPRHRVRRFPGVGWVCRECREFWWDR